MMIKRILIFCICTLFISCNLKNKDNNITHNEEIAKTIQGCWQLTTETKVALQPNPEDPNYVLGVLTYKTSTIQNILPNQRFETTIKQEGISFIITDDKVDKDSIDVNNILTLPNQIILISGKYSVSSDNIITLDLENISINESDVIPYDIFYANNETFGSSHQIMTWKIKEDILTFIDNNNKKINSISYRKK